MALDRQSIEKKDFPIGRRGYDPEAVDSHLHTLADEIDELKRSARRRSESLAAAASEQVRSIVEAAETSAADIQRQAEDEAREIRAEAGTEADATREHATSEAREYVGRVSESTSGMLERLDAMESELSALIESLRTGSNRLNADLQLLEGNLGEVRGSVAPRGRFEPEEPGSGSAGPEIRAAAVPPRYEPPAAEPELNEAADTDIRVTQTDHSVAEPEPVQPAGGGETAVEAGAGDAEGARLIALNMALNGTPREETDRYLAENFQITNRAALLDEVYASVET